MEQERLYTKGYNHGYLLAKYLPGLLSKIVKSIQPLGGYFSGFLSGKREFEAERSQEQLDGLKRIREAYRGDVNREREE